MPTFVVGFPRSGTTALAQAISRIRDRYNTSREGHLFYLFAPAIARIRLNQLNPQSVLRKKACLDIFTEQFKKTLAQTFAGTEEDKGDWLDKTPDIHQILSIPDILYLYPDAKFLYIYRPPAEAVRSNMAAWPELLRDREREIAERWAKCSAAWRGQRSLIPVGKRVEIFQPDMRAKPQETGIKIANFLECADEDRQRIVAFLHNNKAVNRPVGDDAKTYDDISLSEIGRKIVAEVTAEETAKWPRLSA